MAYTLPDLGYSFDALEPHIDAATMEIHHDRHHQAYITNVNAAIAGKADLEAKSPEELISDLNSIPEDIRGAVRNNGGGHVNHSFFWKVIAPGGASAPSGDLAAAIDAACATYRSTWFRCRARNRQPVSDPSCTRLCHVGVERGI